jgi:hypothetical protein
MTAKQQIIDENQAEAAGKLEEVRAGDTAAGRNPENFTGWYEDRGEVILRTSTGELSQRDYEMLYGDPTRYWTAEQHAEAAQTDENLERQREEMNRGLEAEQ